SERDEIRIDERTQQPGPYSALMISSIALFRRALVARFVARVGALQRSQADWCEQLALDNADDRLLPVPFEESEGQTDGKDLVRAESRVAAFRSQNVMQALSFGIPESRPKTVADSICLCAVFCSAPLRHKGKRSMPKRVDFDGLPRARSEFCVHPGE